MVENLFALGDELGPAKIVHVCEPERGLKGVLVIDNVAAGPSIGGLRMAPDVSTIECARLARAMTLKNASAGLPHGGGKSIIFGDPKMPIKKKESLVRSFAHALRHESDYIFGPDMGTDETCMAWVNDEIGRSVGLPLELGGIPLDTIGATGWGIYQAVKVAIKYCDFKLDGARLVVQGFGAVGQHAARFLSKKGVILVGAADSQGTIYDQQGLDIEALAELKGLGKSVIDFPDGKKLSRDEVIDIECDIWLPAARPDVIHEKNVSRLKCKLVPQGANIPFTYGAEKYLHKRGILCLPDFIANAGGVICAAVEYQGASQSMAFQAIKEKVKNNTAKMLKEATEQNMLPRDTAIKIATRHVKKAMSYRRYSIL